MAVTSNLHFHSDLFTFTISFFWVILVCCIAFSANQVVTNKKYLVLDLPYIVSLVTSLGTANAVVLGCRTNKQSIFETLVDYAVRRRHRGLGTMDRDTSDK